MKILTKEDIAKALEITPSGCIASKWLKGDYYAINLYFHPTDQLWSIELESIPYGKSTRKLNTTYEGELEEALEIYNSMS